MTTSIWIVESGEYDDYSLNAAYTNEEAARKHADIVNSVPGYGTPCSVSELVVEDECPDLRWVYTATMHTKGKSQPVHLNDGERVTEVIEGSVKFDFMVIGTDKTEVEVVYRSQMKSRKR